MVSKRTWRTVFALLLAISVLFTGYSYASGTSKASFDKHLDANGVATNKPIVKPRNDITVVATDSNSWRGNSDSPRARSELVAFNRNGSRLYYNDSHSRYWDVDPVKGTKTTVEYAYANNLPKSKCPTQWNRSQQHVDKKTWQTYMQVQGKENGCTLDGYERVNLTTGNVTPIWSQYTPGEDATRYHDIDRLNESHLVVADIFLDRVFIVNTKTGKIGWTWNASDAFPPNKTGGPYPKDWTHINNVQVLKDGRIAVSVRNLDQVVFLKPGHGIEKNWTLGANHHFGTLYAQHNPDYINRSNGGPAELVADSDNNRVVEYQRDHGSWKRTWTWEDPQMQWPRDADRLPDGHTLITDSNGNRVFEVNKNGKIVWDVHIAFPYEAERLGTGDESAGGPSAQQAHLKSRTNGPIDQFWIGVKGALPGKYLNALMYITPVWVGLPEVCAILGGLLVILVWGGAEIRWFITRRYRVSTVTEDDYADD